MKNNFIKCGLIGWCLEVAWTGLHSLMRRDKKMLCNTSLLMFPIYGMAAWLQPVCRFVKNKNVIVRGGIYTFLIFAAEYVSGMLLKKRGMCPWDYGKSKYNINGVVRLDYAPAWFVTGLLYEKVFKQK